MPDGLLVLNAGSSSIKFSVFAVSAGDDSLANDPLADDPLALVCRGGLESLGEADPQFKAVDQTGRVLIETRPKPRTGRYDHQAALEDLLAWLRDSAELPDVVAVGHRVVHGSDDYSDPQRITPEILARLESFVPLAPLHQPHNLAGIRALLQSRPDLPQVACFDTAFHHGQAELVKRYALPSVYWDEGVRRYGFHGLSYEYIAGALAAAAGTAATGRVVVAHLGNGASMCAMHDGRSIASTMGFTAVEGLPMGTRSGSLDPGVLLYLMEQHGLDARALTELLYKQSGLLALSGLSNDMRDLLASTSPQAQGAVDYFCYRIARELGSLAAALGGLDALVFTGGIGEHAAPVRAQVCARSAWLGVQLDEAANASHARQISQPGSAITVWVLPTNEEWVIARHTRRLMQSPKPD